MLGGLVSILATKLARRSWLNKAWNCGSDSNSAVYFFG
jgi:hypothetical protein